MRRKGRKAPTWLAAMTGLDADATAQAASTPHARRPAFLAPAAERHAGSVLPPVSAAEHATRHLGRRGRQSTAPAGEARQDGAMPMRVCEVVGLGRGGTREGGDEAASERSSLRGAILSAYPSVPSSPGFVSRPLGQPLATGPT